MISSVIENSTKGKKNKGKFNRIIEIFMKKIWCKVQKGTRNLHLLVDSLDVYEVHKKPCLIISVIRNRQQFSVCHCLTHTHKEYKGNSSLSRFQKCRLNVNIFIHRWWIQWSPSNENPLVRILLHSLHIYWKGL